MISDVVAEALCEVNIFWLRISCADVYLNLRGFSPTDLIALLPRVVVGRLSMVMQAGVGSPLFFLVWLLHHCLGAIVA
jgi:hypothetical protein